MKRIVALLIAVSMVLSVFSTVFATATYTDLVGDNIKYAGAVAALSELRVDDQPVINGYQDKTFKPEKEVTRAELAKMLVVCMGIGDLSQSAKERKVFSDVATTHWGAGWINTAANSKIIVGYPDGTFGPEKTVTYAEAFTMALRALGYGNVADFEGTWPTSYMLKATELGLTKDMDAFTNQAAATRGNIAILLWNMLRTPMWKVTEESEHSGMTLSANNRRMLNIKFPDYDYAEAVYIVDIDVVDNDDVSITIDDEGFRTTAQIRNVDLSRLVLGMRVTSLIKAGKKGEDDVYLTLTPENELVEGIITEVDGNKFTVNGVEYKYDETKGDMPDGMIEVDNYVVFEVEGKKVKTYGEDRPVFVIKALPVGGKEVENLKTSINKIKEDAVIIRNGEWIEKSDIQEGDVFTENKEFGNAYWMIASVDDRVSGSFESYTSTTKNKVTSNFIEVDGESYRVINPDFEALEGEKNNKNIALDKTGLQAKPKENKYLGAEVELVLDYLGTPIKALFGEVQDLTNGGDFYAVVNGYWTTSQKGGSIKTISLVGENGEGASKDEESEGVDYQIKKTTAVDDALEQDEVFGAGLPIFVWANFEDDGETIKTILPLEDGMTSGDPEKYKSKYDILDISGEKMEDGKIAGYKVTDSTKVMVVTPVKDDDDAVVGFSVDLDRKLTNGDEMPAGSFLAFNPKSKVDKAMYVFLAEEAESKVWTFGLVDDYDNTNKAGVEKITINGEEMELSEDSELAPIDEFVEGDVVGYTIYKGKVNVHFACTPADLAGASIILDDADARDTNTLVFDNVDDSFDLDDDSEDVKTYKNYKVVVVECGEEDSGDDLRVIFESCEELEAKGLAALAEYISDGNRVLFSVTDQKYILVFTGLRLDEAVTAEGLLVEREVGSSNGKTESDTTDTYVISFRWAENTQISGDRASLPESETVDAGAAWEYDYASDAGFESGDEHYDAEVNPDSISAVNEDREVEYGLYMTV